MRLEIKPDGTPMLVIKEPKVKKELIPFYGGKVMIEKKLWGKHFTYKRVGSQNTLLSVTRVTSKLSKGNVLIDWAVNLVGKHITSYIEKSEFPNFTRDEIFNLVKEAVTQPEQAKIKGGRAGSLIHDYAHKFALACITKDENLPDFEELLKTEEDEGVRERARNGISAFLDWYNKNEVEFLKMEELVYYNSFHAGVTTDEADPTEFIGIYDLIARVNGKIMVVDYKSSKGIYSEQEYQVAAYNVAINMDDSYPLKVETSCIVDFHKETGELLVKEIPFVDGAKDWAAFMGLYAAAVREKEKGNK